MKIKLVNSIVLATAFLTCSPTVASDYYFGGFTSGIHSSFIPNIESSQQQTYSHGLSDSPYKNVLKLVANSLSDRSHETGSFIISDDISSMMDNIYSPYSMNEIHPLNIKTDGRGVVLKPNIYSNLGLHDYGKSASFGYQNLETTPFSTYKAIPFSSDYNHFLADGRGVVLKPIDMLVNTASNNPFSAIVFE